jgi:hypothetical protein
LNNATKTQLRNLMLFFLLLLFAVPVYSATPQGKAAGILDQMRDAYEKSIEKIDDYVMVTNLKTHYYKKAFDNGRPYFKVRSEIQSRNRTREIASGTDFNPFDPDIFDKLKEKATYKGTETIEGVTTHVLFIDEIDAGHELEIEGAESLRNIYFYVDPENWLIRQIKAEADIEPEQGQKQTVHTHISMSDYRWHEGMPVAYSTIMQIDGLMPEMSEQKRKEAQKSLEQMEREFADMPADQRKMMENMMGTSLEQMRRMVHGESMEFKIEVKEIRVNTGMKDFD